MAYYAVPSHRFAQIAGFALLTAGLAALLVFVAAIRAQLAPDEPWSSLILGAGVATVVCLLIANTLWASTAFTAVIEKSRGVGVNVHLMFEDSGFAFLVAGGVMAATFVAATSLAMAQTAGYPKWLAGLGLPVALALLAVYWYLPLFAFFAWIFVVSLNGLTQKPSSSAS